ncbi:FN3 associated domain-containing protein [Algoriphagus sp.]|uniref:FN3 associated domain-containing protein n=1 Tax=Algoriphagus sp. TaxID=1872435 RepID=UPI0025DFAC90|nr:FN3 associated domain-containing protein [Algoriphagus sp.]
MISLSSFRSILENTLFVWLGLALILTIGGDNLFLPEWLQVIGRSHPLILHFPIVLLLFGLLFFWIPNLNTKKDLKEFGELSFLLGCNFAGITVLAGLILAQENYEGAALDWHKWAGLAVFGLSTLLYFFRNQSIRFSKSLSAIIAVGVLLAGHWGADLTHGENFLLAPILKEEQETLALNEAEVFRDVVQPILQAKCISCHKEGKIKGELRMDQIDHIKKGGKSGPFVVPGDFDNSLLVTRINLPMEEKEHMPPKNKIQLTDEEKTILMDWVYSGASFDQKLEEIDSQTDLFQLASQKFTTTENYDFNSADPETISELNNFFREVAPVYPGSPALVVSYFGISAFDPSSLDELKAIGEQVVQLNLNKMPLEGVSFGFLSNFPNLRELQANFTNLTSDEISEISKLENLTSLAISGNTIDEKSLESLSKMKSLEKLFLWQTGLSDPQKDLLRNQLPDTKIEFGFDGRGVIYDLNSPTIISEINMFADSTKLEITHPIKTVEIRYTTDGEEPDSTSSSIYNEPIWINKTAEVKARAFAKDWKGSPSSSVLLFRSGNPPKELKLLTQPNPNYFGKGELTLIDQIKGKNNHTSGEWLGFQDEDPEVEITLADGQRPKELTLSLLYHEGAYIFPPTQVEVWISNNGNWEKIVDEVPAQSKDIKPSRFEALNYDMPNKEFNKVKIKMKTIKSLPKWHPGAGSKGWVFIDEISFLD